MLSLRLVIVFLASQNQRGPQTKTTGITEGKVNNVQKAVEPEAFNVYILYIYIYKTTNIMCKDRRMLHNCNKHLGIIKKMIKGYRVLQQLYTHLLRSVTFTASMKWSYKMRVRGWRNSERTLAWFEMTRKSIMKKEVALTRGKTANASYKRQCTYNVWDVIFSCMTVLSYWSYKKKKTVCRYVTEIQMYESNGARTYIRYTRRQSCHVCSEDSVFCMT